MKGQRGAGGYERSALPGLLHPCKGLSLPCCRTPLCSWVKQRRAEGREGRDTAGKGGRLGTQRTGIQHSEGWGRSQMGQNCRETSGQGSEIKGTADSFWSVLKMLGLG